MGQLRPSNPLLTVTHPNHTGRICAYLMGVTRDFVSLRMTPSRIVLIKRNTLTARHYGDRRDKKINWFCLVVDVNRPRVRACVASVCTRSGNGCAWRCRARRSCKVGHLSTPLSLLLGPSWEAGGVSRGLAPASLNSCLKVQVLLDGLR